MIGARRAHSASHLRQERSFTDWLTIGRALAAGPGHQDAGTDAAPVLPTRHVPVRARFTATAATLDPGVVLHRSPDLPWGGEFNEGGGYADRARQMSAAFDRLTVQDRRFLADGDTVVVTCRLITRLAPRV